MTFAPAPLAEDHAQAEAIEALFKEARRRRRRRWVAGLLAVALLAVALALGLGRWVPGPPPTWTGHPGTSGGAGSQVSWGTPATIRTEMLDFFFPTSGSDFAAGMNFANWETSVQAEATSQCLAAAGFHVTAPSPAAIAGGDNTEFPDLPYLLQHGFFVRGDPASPASDPTRGMSEAEAAAYRSTDRRCRSSAYAGFEALLQVAAPLEQQWMDIVTTIDNGPQFQQALVGWRTCTRRSGVDVSTIEDFFAVADSTATHGGSAQESLHLARIYAGCLGPAEAVRDQLRQQARTTFFTSHPAVIAQLTSMVVVRS